MGAYDCTEQCGCATRDCCCGAQHCMTSKYVLVHDGTDVIVSQKLDNQQVSTTHTIIEYDTEQDMLDAIDTLGLNPIPENEE